jgi:nicotinamide-nucleotide adenylyltransferase
VRGILIGRFQPFHAGHLAVVRELRTTRPSDELILGVGSAQESYTWKNPFTAGERLEMIHLALAEAKLDGVTALPIPDIQRHALWVRYVESMVPPFQRVHTNNPLTRLLFEQAGYSVDAPKLVDRPQLQGEVIRQRIADDREWRALVPSEVGAYLSDLKAPARLRLLRVGDAEPSGSRPG